MHPHPEDTACRLIQVSFRPLVTEEMFLCLVDAFEDDTLANGTAAEAADLKFKLLSARGDGVTKEQAANASDVSAAGVLMDPLDFYQVRH